jgi:hypothetical protein
VVDGEGEVAEVGLAADGRDQRGDQVCHQGGHQGCEREADDDRDGEVDEIAAEQELLEAAHLGPSHALLAHGRMVGH